MKASESFKGFNPGKYGAQNPSSLEGFLFPATYDLPRHQRGRPDRAPARRLQAVHLAGEHEVREVEEPHPLRRLIIASMIEREAVVEKDRKLVAAVIYNRLQPGHPAPDRRHHPLRREQLDEAAHRFRPADQLALQHLHEHGPAADADRQPGPRLDPGGGAPATSTTCTTSSSPAAATSSPPPTRSSRPLGRYNSAREAAAASRRPTAPSRPASAGARVASVHAEAPRGPRPAGLPFALAGDAQRRARRARPGRRMDLRGDRGRAGRFAARVRALPREGFVGANVTVRTSSRRCPLRRGFRGRARDRRREHAQLRERAVAAENTDATGFLDALGDRRPERALVLGAGGSARAVVWALVTREPRSRSGTDRGGGRALGARAGASGGRGRRRPMST